MTRLGVRPYRAGDRPGQRSVPISVVVLTRDEEPNIRRCLDSVAWADQVVVLDSGSSDATVAIARSLGADVLSQSWLGYSAQRDYALRLPEIRHDWVYFVDADEWVSPPLASEIAMQLRSPSCAGFAHRLRLVFQGTWIRHCGWYSASLVVRLVDRRYAKFNGDVFGERACVDGPVHRLRNDIVDEDLKGLVSWLHKHVRYAHLEAERRGLAGSAGRADAQNPAPGFHRHEAAGPDAAQGRHLPFRARQAFGAVYVHVPGPAGISGWAGRASLLLLSRVVRGHRGRVASGRRRYRTRGRRHA